MNTDWDMLDPREWGTPALRAALELVGQRDSVDHVVVAPRDPSAEMIADGAKAGDVSPELALRIYAAMVRGL